MIGEREMVRCHTLNLEATLRAVNNENKAEEKNADEAKKSKSKSIDPSTAALFSCERVKAKKRKLKMLKYTSQVRQAKIYRDIGFIAMEKDEDWACDKALEYLNKSWKVC